MSTITLQNFRVGSDLTVKVRLKDGGVAIDWSTLSGIRAVLYSDAQSSIAGRCDVTVDGEDPTLLVCRYAATKMQYLGVNRIVVSAKYMGVTKTYDKPAFTFVRWSEDQAGEELTIEDPEVTVEIEVQDVTSSILQEAVDAALSAAEKAEEAAALVPLQVLQDCVEATEDANEAAEAANAAGITSVEASIADNEPGTPSVEATMLNKILTLVFHHLKGVKGDTGATPNITVGTVTTGEPGTAVVVTMTGTAESPVLNITIPQGLKGDQGNPGSTQDYPFELVNNLTTNDATKGLSAAQGYVLDGKVSQLQQEVDDFSLPIISGKTVALGGTIGATITLTPNNETGWNCVVFPCVEGDSFFITGHGGSSTRLWGFVDAENKLIAVSTAGLTGTNLKVVAPANSANFVSNAQGNLSVVCRKNGSLPDVNERLNNITPEVEDISTRVTGCAAIGFISTHESDKIAITDTTITIPKNTRIVYGLNGFSYTATQSSATVINRDSNFEQLIVFNIGTKTIVGRMVNAVQANDVILFMVQNNTNNKRKISLHPSLYTYNGESPFATGDEIGTENNASYPFKSGGVPSIPSWSTTYTAISGITLVNGHKYRVKLVAESTFTAPSDFNMKIMTADSDATVFRVFAMGGATVSTLETEFVWEGQTADDYRCGFFGNNVVNVGISVYIEDITIDTIEGVKWDVIERNKYKEASLISTVSHRGNVAIKVADKFSLLHFSDVHGNTANIADVVEYMTHYADYLDDTIHTGDSVMTHIGNPNPFESVDGAEKILNVIGNHEAWLNTSDQDYYATEKQTYDKIFAPSIADWNVVQPTGAAENGYCYYYKDYTTAGFRLIVLDSVHWHYRNGVTDSNPTQKAWFESVLADARTNNLRVVCAMHYPPQNGIVPVANDTGWNAPILSDSGGLVGDGWYAADEIFGCVDAFITAGGKFNGWIMGHTHEDFFGKVLGHTEQPIVVIGTANGSGYIYDKFVSGTVAQDNFNIITFENLNSKDYIKIVKMGGDCDVLMRSKKTICYNVTDGILVSTT